MVDVAREACPLESLVAAHEFRLAKLPKGQLAQFEMWSYRFSAFGLRKASRICRHSGGFANTSSQTF